MLKRTKLFLDTKFTGLRQDTSLISLALVAETGESFYAEFTDYKRDQVDDFIRNNIIPSLGGFRNFYAGDKWPLHQRVVKYDKEYFIRDNTEKILWALKIWLNRFNRIEIWTDVGAWDWVLFCEILAVCGILDSKTQRTGR